MEPWRAEEGDLRKASSGASCRPGEGEHDGCVESFYGDGALMGRGRGAVHPWRGAGVPGRLDGGGGGRFHFLFRLRDGSGGFSDKSENAFCENPALGGAAFFLS